MLRKILMSLFFVCLSLFVASGQGRVKLVGSSGHNVTYGTFGAGKLSADFSFADFFQVRGAARLVSFPGMTVDARPSYFHDFAFGRIKAEALLSYRYQHTTSDVAAGFGARLQMKWFWLDLGYYYRVLCPKNGSPMSDPFNLYYELGFSCLPDCERWDLFAVVSNSRLAELERLHYPSLIVEALYYPVENLGVVFGCECSRSGMFHLSGSHRQCCMKLGVQYSW